MKIKVIMAVLFTAVLAVACKTSKQDVTMDVLSGHWNIISVNGENVPSDMENKPFMEFDVKEQRIHGNSGCNIMNGGFFQKKGQPNSLLLSRMASTMMACPNMEIEGKVLEALRNVVSFSKISNDKLALCDKDGKQIVVLQK